MFKFVLKRTFMRNRRSENSIRSVRTFWFFYLLQLIDKLCRWTWIIWINQDFSGVAESECMVTKRAILCSPHDNLSVPCQPFHVKAPIPLNTAIIFKIVKRKLLSLLLTLSVPHGTEKKQYFHANNTHLSGICKMWYFCQFHPVFKNVSIGIVSKVIFGEFESNVKLTTYFHSWKLLKSMYTLLYCVTFSGKDFTFPIY